MTEETNQETNGETKQDPSDNKVPIATRAVTPRRSPLIYVGVAALILALLYGATALIKSTAGNSPRAYENTLNKEWGELADDSKEYAFFLGKMGSAEDVIALGIANSEYKKNVDDKADIFNRMKDDPEYPGLSAQFLSAFTAYQIYLSKIEIVVRNPDGVQVAQDLKELQFLGEDAKKKVMAAEDSAEFLRMEFDEKVFDAAAYIGPHTAGNAFGDGTDN